MVLKLQYFRQVARKSCSGISPLEITYIFFLDAITISGSTVYDITITLCL